MPETKLISPGIPNYTLKRNLRFNNNYISNDGDDEGIRIDNAGSVVCSTSLSGTQVGNQFDIDYDATTSGASVGVQIVSSVDSAVASGQTVSLIGLDIDTNSTNASTVGSIDLYGIDIDITGRTEGTQTAYGLDVSVSSADTNYGIICASADRQLRLGYDGSSYLDITVADDSHTTLATAESGNIILNPSGDITLKPAGGDIAFHDGTSDIFKFDVATPTFYMYDDADTSGLRDYLSITVGTGGATQITTNDDSASNANLTFTIDGDIEMESLFDDITFKSAGNMYLNSGTSIFLDAESGNCRLTDDSETDNVFTPAHDADITTKKYVDDNIHTIVPTASTTDVLFDGCAAGFDKETTTFAASAVLSEANDSTDIDFRLGNKHELTLLDDIAGSGEYINLIFPAISGNFILVLIQGNASCTVAANGWRVYAHDETLGDNLVGENLADGKLRFAGGSAPTLTTTQYKSDILSIYWDADNQTAFAVASLNF